MDDNPQVHLSAEVGRGTKIWGHSQVREGAVIGTDRVIGRGVYIGPGVRIGDRAKVQNAAQIYDPAVLGDGVFVGPGAVLTNDRRPRAVDDTLQPLRAGAWRREGVTVDEGASVGAGAVCVAPLSIGRWAMVGAGAVVTEDVPDFALVVGVPARRIGWVGRAGVRLTQANERTWVCPITAVEYLETSGRLEEEQQP